LSEVKERSKFVEASEDQEKGSGEEEGT